MKSTHLTKQNNRTVVIDIIRGFALLGVLFANFNSFAEQQIPEPILNSISSSTDKMLMCINSLFLEWKFMSLFSILFGYGFGLILESLDRKKINPNLFFIKRMFWLFVLGIMHCLFWWGDVLHLYAMSGVLLLFFRRQSNNVIIVCGILFAFIVPVCINYLLRYLPETFTEADIQELYYQYKQGSIADVIRFNIDFYNRMFMVSGSNLHDIVETLGRFLIGYFLLRIQFFSNVESKKPVFIRVALISAPLMISYFIVRILLLNNMISLNPYLKSLMLSLGIFATTTCYVSTLIIVYNTLGLNLFFSALQSIGRMTLTNYLGVSAFLVVLLYGFGFNKLGELPIYKMWLVALIWLMIEITYSIYWLRVFRYGPMEWLWRQLTYWKRMQLRK
ncbi:membrane protein [Bacteroidota bacterium]|nr:membrane protein [Bacteroidota bacterium]